MVRVHLVVPITRVSAILEGDSVWSGEYRAGSNPATLTISREALTSCYGAWNQMERYSAVTRGKTGSLPARHTISVWVYQAQHLYQGVAQLAQSTRFGSGRLKVQILSPWPFSPTISSTWRKVGVFLENPSCSCYCLYIDGRQGADRVEKRKVLCLALKSEGLTPKAW